MQSPAHTNISEMSSPRAVPSLALISDELGRVKELIDEQLAATFSAGLTEDAGMAISYLRKQVCSGKMLRPGLVLLAGAAFGKLTDQHVLVAAIVEMIHNATLLHDDVIDEGKKRRGKPTVNSLWGNESAVLLGDFLLSRVFRMSADLEPQTIKLIAETAARTCEGELRQLSQRHNWQLSESEYIDIITEKSAALFSAACFLGAILAQAGQEQAQLFSCFGRNLGIAFQITDDLLDIVGDEGKTGKTLGSDVDKNKLTLAVIHLLKAVEQKERKSLIEKLNCRTENRKDLAVMLRAYGSLEYAHSRAQEFITKATEALTDLKQSYAKDILIETAKFIAGRVVISRRLANG